MVFFIPFFSHEYAIEKTETKYHFCSHIKSNAMKSFFHLKQMKATTKAASPGSHLRQHLPTQEIVACFPVIVTGTNIFIHQYSFI